MKTLYKSQQKAIGLIYFLIELLNLFDTQKTLTKNNIFKILTIKYIQDIIKDKMSAVINNLKLSISSLKISLNAIKEFSILIINNKTTKSVSILQFLFRTLTNNIGILSHSFYWKIENVNINNESDKNEARKKIKSEDEIN